MPPIGGFLGNLIAFWRPQKNSYFALYWDANIRKWTRWNGNFGEISKHKTTAHAGVTGINITLSNDSTLQIVSDGEFLKTDTPNINIIIVKRSGGALIPNNWKNHDFGATLIERLPVNRNTPLWTVLGPAASTLAAAITAAPAPAPPFASANVFCEAIPRRIAWLIAEDACKNNETCAITLDPISPLTASVTSCFHSFDNHALKAWLSTKNTCPTCRKPCKATEAFDS